MRNLVALERGHPVVQAGGIIVVADFGQKRSVRRNLVRPDFSLLLSRRLSHSASPSSSELGGNECSCVFADGHESSLSSVGCSTTMADGAAESICRTESAEA